MGAVPPASCLPAAGWGLQRGAAARRVITADTQRLPRRGLCSPAKAAGRGWQPSNQRQHTLPCIAPPTAEQCWRIA